MLWSPIPPERLLTLDARRICLVKPSALGDVVQTLPLLPALRERFPSASISWMINRELRELVDGHPQLDEVIPFERHGSPRTWLRLLSKLRSRQFDLVFDLQGLLRTGLLTLATRAAVRVGLETAREGAQLAVHCTIPRTGRKVPAHARYWRVAEALGIEGPPRPTILAISDADQEWAEQRVQSLRSPILAVNPGARWITKRWPVERFAAIAARAVRSCGASVIVLGSRAESELADDFQRLLREQVPSVSVLNLAGQTTLKQLAAVLQRVDVVLTNDSGPMHLAAGLGKPVLGLFTCTSPLRSGPPGERHELVATKVPCAASYKKECPHRGVTHLACHQELDTTRVWHAFRRLIDKNGLNRRAA